MHKKGKNLILLVGLICSLVFSGTLTGLAGDNNTAGKALKDSNPSSSSNGNTNHIFKTALAKKPTPTPAHYDSSKPIVLEDKVKKIKKTIFPNGSIIIEDGLRNTVTTVHTDGYITVNDKENKVIKTICSDGKIIVNDKLNDLTRTLFVDGAVKLYRNDSDTGLTFNPDGSVIVSDGTPYEKYYNTDGTIRINPTAFIDRQLKEAGINTEMFWINKIIMAKSVGDEGYYISFSVGCFGDTNEAKKALKVLVPALFEEFQLAYLFISFFHSNFLNLECSLDSYNKNKDKWKTVKPEDVFTLFRVSEP